MGNEILDLDHKTEPVSDPNMVLQIRLPKDTSILTTGIIAIPFSFGLIGLVLAIVTLVNASKATKIYNEDREKYLEKSVKKVRAGKVCAIISLSLFVLAIIIVIAANA